MGRLQSFINITTRVKLNGCILGSGGGVVWFRLCRGHTLCHRLEAEVPGNRERGVRINEINEIKKLNK